VRDKDDSFVLQEALDAVVKDVLAGMLINRTQGVVKQDNVCIMVSCPCKANPLPLTTRQVDAALSSNTLVTCVRQGAVFEQAGSKALCPP
jgi:hypothetical protein